MSLFNDPASTIREKARLLWEQYGRSFLQIHPINGWDQNRWQKAAVNDLTYQYNRVSQLHILGRGPGETLAKLYTQVYLMEEHVAFERYGNDKMRAGTWMGRVTTHKGERLDGLALASTQSRLYILGQPGAGKTTFLKRIALEAMADNIPQWPVFVPLVEVAQSTQTVHGFLTAQFAVAGFINEQELTQYLLQEYCLLLLLDGLDEVPVEQNQRLQIIREIQQLSDRYPHIRLLVTCRNASANHQFTGMRYAEMAEFDELQMETFINNWFRPGKAEIAVTCYQALKQSDALREMAREPLLLTLLCLAYHPEKGFPSRRAGIYQTAIEGLLRDWDEKRGVTRETIAGLQPNQIQELLAYLAYQTFSDGHQLLAGQRLIRNIESYCQRKFNQRVDGHQWLKQVEANTGLLVEYLHGVYAFAHLTFHEYLAAWWIIEKESWDVFQPHLANPRWSEVLLLMAELPLDATLYLTLFLDAMQQMVAADKTITALLQWGAIKSAESGESPPAFRAFYINLYLDLALKFDLDGALNFDRTLELSANHAFNLAFDLHPSLDPDLAIDLKLRAFLAHNPLFDPSYVPAFNPPRQVSRVAPTFTITQGLTNVLAQGLTGTLAQVFTLSLDLALASAFAIDFLLSMVLRVAQILAVRGAKVMDENVAAELRKTAAQLDQFCHSSNMPDLQVALATLPLPTANANNTELEIFATRLQEIARTYRDLGHEWNLSHLQVSLLKRYLEADRLFVECLNRANVPDRAAIENQILLPPDM